ncbi:MAG: UDPGP type 1 family protein [Pirellulaceae bacterium]|nr:UDPGP type 1 family protein [Pirellulaceae bacterium]
MNSEWMSQLKESGQQHLLQYFEALDEGSQARLLEQFREIDFPLVQDLFGKFGQADEWGELARQAEPPAAIRLQGAPNGFASRDEAMQRGEEAIANGEVGMVMVAGGQGSRLGFAHPKGLFPIGPVSGRTLLQIHIDKLKSINDKYGSSIPLYVMTSPATHHETTDFLERNQWFGYPTEHTAIFCQGTMPAVDAETGRMIMAERDQLFLSPDGHGGMLSALTKSGSLNDMKLRGIEQIFYCQIDNPLAQICDPVTIGHHVLAASEMTCQAVPKREPLQKVGNIVSIEGRTQIIEYSDLPEAVARKTNPDGTLMLWAGSIAVHVIDVAFLDRMTEYADALPFHLAHKKVPFLNSEGVLIEPSEPNALKFERFIFDLLPQAKQAIVIEVDPQEAFSPVKNAPTEKSNTALTAQQAMIAQATRVLAGAEVTVAEGVAVEMHPALAIDQERLAIALQGQKHIVEPTYFQ